MVPLRPPDPTHRPLPDKPSQPTPPLKPNHPSPAKQTRPHTDFAETLRPWPPQTLLTLEQFETVPYVTQYQQKHAELSQLQLKLQLQHVVPAV